MAGESDRSSSLAELVALTDNFGELLGEGKFGCVYSGWQAEEQRAVAVKVLPCIGVAGASLRRFTREQLDALLDVRHPNVVPLLALCFERTALIYDLVTGGTLAGHLVEFAECGFGLAAMLDVSLALEYLHAQNPPIIHGAVTAHNVLLDVWCDAALPLSPPWSRRPKWRCRIADLGVVSSLELADGCGHRFVDRILSAPGYNDPHYVNTGTLTTKTDVFALGVIMFQVMTQKQAVHEGQPLVDTLLSCLGAGAAVFDLWELHGHAPVESVEALFELTAQCASTLLRLRPCAHDIATYLDCVIREGDFGSRAWMHDSLSVADSAATIEVSQQHRPRRENSDINSGVVVRVLGLEKRSWLNRLLGIVVQRDVVGANHWEVDLLFGRGRRELTVIAEKNLEGVCGARVGVDPLGRVATVTAPFETIRQLTAQVDEVCGVCRDFCFLSVEASDRAALEQIRGQLINQRNSTLLGVAAPNSTRAAFHVAATATSLNPVAFEAEAARAQTEAGLDVVNLCIVDEDMVDLSLDSDCGTSFEMVSFARFDSIMPVTTLCDNGGFRGFAFVCFEAIAVDNAVRPLQTDVPLLAEVEHRRELANFGSTEEDLGNESHDTCRSDVDGDYYRVHVDKGFTAESRCNDLAWLAESEARHASDIEEVLRLFDVAKACGQELTRSDGLAVCVDIDRRDFAEQHSVPTGFAGQ
eukprot:TRINITY_DN44298_c0_g1_i1.p1 TRINITY_DN44298_c0_g1~~TRINITY_DN44298_c0_g1_i1.p1  ORF type:complete len:698 (+),score=134.33 TRINITY_DN44298_c0_g1_i1:69-2162(+)